MLLTSSEVIEIARDLKSDGDNKEYDRALIEICCDATGVGFDGFDEMAATLGIKNPHEPATIKLGRVQRNCLREAARRYCEFHRGENPETAWTGLGLPSDYYPVTRTGLMVPTSQEFPRCAQWYKLTPRGVTALIQLLEQEG